MSMYITIEKYVSTFKSLSHHHFCGAILGALFHAWSNPLAVEVQAAERGSVVAYEHTVWVQHRNDLEHEVVSQVLGNLIV